MQFQVEVLVAPLPADHSTYYHRGWVNFTCSRAYFVFLRQLELRTFYNMLMIVQIIPSHERHHL